MGFKTGYKVTQHFDLRLLSRTGTLDYDPKQMWDDGIPVEVEGHVYSEARYDAAHDLLLLRKGDGLVTGLRAENVDFTEIKPKKTCRTCGHHQLDPKPHDPCDACRTNTPDWIE